MGRKRLPSSAENGTDRSISLLLKLEQEPKVGQVVTAGQQQWKAWEARGTSWTGTVVPQPGHCKDPHLSS